MSDPDTDEQETYRHFFLECRHSKGALDPTALKYNIPLPDTTTNGESNFTIIYKKVTGMKKGPITFMPFINYFLQRVGPERFYPIGTISRQF